MASPEGRQKIDWQPDLTALEKKIGDLDHLRLCESVSVRLLQFLSGLEKWQTHPYLREVSEPPVIWSTGSSRLLDFGSCDGALNPNGPPVLIVPSLINRAYILDLNKDYSLVRFLATRGLRPLLMEWGTPTGEEQNFNLNSYITQRLMPILQVTESLSKHPVGALGYCMGGTLAAGLLAQKSTRVGAFSTIGSPWDFDKSKGTTAALQHAFKDVNVTNILDSFGKAFGLVPAEIFQHLFALINPMQAAVKFRKFDRMEANSASERHFVAIEDWLADGVPLPTRSAQDILVEWGLNNKTARGEWECLGAKVDLSKINQPTLHICGKRDSITQLDVATAMAADIPNAKVIRPDTGHIGLIVGSNARETVWKPVSQFFLQHLS